MLHNEPIYMDHHATTPVDPRVVDTMLPYFTEKFGNAASTTHGFGHVASSAVKAARESIAKAVGARASEIVFTSGATESNNLAILGAATRYRDEGKHIVSVATEHPAVLDPLSQLEKRGYQVTLLPVAASGSGDAGLVTADQVAEALREDTILVTVMAANNEIGAIQPIQAIARLCKEREILFHTDATQAVGRIPVDVLALDVDLMSFSAHKMYGPKGVGALFVRRRTPFVRLEPLIFGGGHERSLRSGTLNVPGIIGMARALELCIEEMENEAERLATLRNLLFDGLASQLDGVHLNGPALDARRRLPGNLNVSFERIDGESLLLSTRNLAASSGSACTSAHPEPSHVLRFLGLTDEAARGSVRFGLGRGNTEDHVDYAVEALVDAVRRLRKMSSLPVLRPDP
jgi:cysteine desulfurase